MIRIATTAVLLTGLFAGGPYASTAQTVDEVVRAMYGAYERHTEGVENYTVIQSAMGTTSVQYFERNVVEGTVLFRSVISSVPTYAFHLEGQAVGYGDVLLFGPFLAERGRFVGTEEQEGRSVHVLSVDDLEGLVLVGPSGAGDVEFVPRSGRIEVDAELGVPVYFDFRGESPRADAPGEVRIRATMEDFREDSGLLYPYHTRIEILGAERVVDPETQARLEDMRRRLDEMPPVQRRLMEEMLAEEMAALEGVLTEDGEPKVIEVSVLEVRVNTGPPGGSSVEAP